MTNCWFPWVSLSVNRLDNSPAVSKHCSDGSNTVVYFVLQKHIAARKFAYIQLWFSQQILTDTNNLLACRNITM